MAGRSAEPLVMRTTHRETGATAWRQLKTTPLYDDDGELLAAVTVIEDITAVKTAEMRMRVLAESGRILASSLDYQQTLRNVANVAVPAFADWCILDLIDESLRRERVIAAHQDPAKRVLAQRAAEIEPPHIDPEGAVGRVFRTGRSELFGVVTPDQIVQAAVNEEHLRLLQELDLRSAVLVPMRVPTRNIGVMTLITAESGRRLYQDDVELAEQLGRRAAVAVENARLHTALAHVAETLQRSLLPDELPDIPGWEIAALYRPAGGRQRLDVGGDFYDVFCGERDCFAIIGDVTGKGVHAAAVTSLLRHGSRFASRHDPRPAAILAQLDQALRSRPIESLCTALCVRLRPREVLISSGGHPPALVVTVDGSVRETPSPGPLLGAFADARWSEETVIVERNELLLLYTDGVTEAVGQDRRFGTERLKALLAEHAGTSPQQLLSRLDQALEQFRSGTAHDDVAALTLRRA
jgi:serine phosphatase RsbU (regulator of sigma subunit)